MFNRFLTRVLRPEGRHPFRQPSKHQLLSSFLTQTSHPLRCMSSAEAASLDAGLITDRFRTNETDPVNHSANHRGMFYTLPPEVVNRLFILGGFEKEQQKLLKTYRETAIMVREPALEIMDYLNRADYSRPVNRYVLWGNIGVGKSYILNHILHFGFQKKFVLLYCPTPTNWTLWPEELAQSQYKAERMDMPIDAAVWLQQFRANNGHLLDELDLRASKQYVWSQREITEPGDPLKNILEHGINRIKHASDCVAVLIKELKMHANEGKCRVLVVADKANAFYERTKVKYPDKSMVEVDNMTIARAFKQMFTNDWRNGAVVTSVCKKIYAPYRIYKLPERPMRRQRARFKPVDSWGPFTARHLSDLPKELLTDKGFKDFDPFIPIEVPVFDHKEMDSYLDYLIDRHWLQRPAAKTPEGRTEIKFMSGMNGGEASYICSGL